MKRIVYLITLSLITICASLFMITESSTYFLTYYGYGSWKPLYLATLLEVFLISLSVIHYGEVWFKRLQNTIMIAIFIVIVSSAGLGSIIPIMGAITDYEKELKLEKAYESKLSSIEEDAKYFQSNSKSVQVADRYSLDKNATHDSYIRSIKESGKSKGEAKLALINIILLITIRFLIQSANLVCARSIGVVYRHEFDDKIENDSSKSENNIIPEIEKELEVINSVPKYDPWNMYALPEIKTETKLKCVRNKENKLYEIWKDDTMICNSSTARGAWRKYHGKS